MKNNTIALLVGILIILSLAGILTNKQTDYITGFATSGDSYTSFNMSEEISILITGAVGFGSGMVYSNASSAILNSELGYYDYPSGYVSFWRFDKANGSNSTFTPDESGRNNGTVINATNTSAGKINQAYSFEGNTTYREHITFGDPADGSLDLQTKDISISFRLKRRQETSPQYIISKGAPSVAAAGYLILLTAPDLMEARISNGSASGYITHTSNKDFTGNFNWNHIVWVIDRDENSTVYINGVLDTTKNISNISQFNIDNTDPFYIGRYPGNLNPLNGTVDEVVFYDRTLSSAEVLDLYKSYGDGGCINGTWFFNRTYFSIENDGTVNISVNYTADKKASQFIGGTIPSFKIKGVVDETGACPDLNTTYAEVSNSTENPKVLCPLLGFGYSVDIFKVPVYLVVPSDVSAGEKNATITFSAAKV